MITGDAKERLSLGLKVKGGYIDGIALLDTKPRADHFPYDHTFQKLVSNIELSSHRQSMLRFKLMVKLEVMNIEPAMMSNTLK